MKNQKTPKKINSEKRPVGRPTNYRDEYKQMMLDYFQREPYELQDVQLVRKDGTEINRKELVPCDFPTFEGFANKLGTYTKVIRSWADKFPEFGSAWAMCQGYQKDIIIQNGLRNLYNPNFAQFVAKNATDMRDKIEGDVNHTATGALGKYMDALLKVGTNDGTGTGGPGRAQ